jgi:dTDP-4-dehydrorhamnose 3,5-epimerase
MFNPIGQAGLLLVEPQVFEDNRGFFYESYNKARFDVAAGRSVTFVQDNHSRSARNVVRGLHYQIGAHAQGKLVRVVAGAILDVAVDIRRSSPSFGRWTALELSADNRKQLWIPEGFAHGFLALSEQAEVIYKTTAPYDRESERAIAWNDPELAIDWQLSGSPIVSDKDRVAPAFRDAEVFA